MRIFTTGVVLGGYQALTTVVFFWVMRDNDFFSRNPGRRATRRPSQVVAKKRRSGRIDIDIIFNCQMGHGSVGYIVGLGDRHSMNILIDEATVEVVHIDLGLAFNQGLMLKTHEQVPFRLTRDIIDGMGVAGVERAFGRCPKHYLDVMRTNKEALLTIFEVT